MTIEQIIEQKCAAAIKPLLDRLSVLEMVATVLSSKLDDAQCRAALAKFCSVEPEVPVKGMSGASPPNPPKVASIDPSSGEPTAKLNCGHTLDDCIEYFKVLDPENFAAVRGVGDIARYVGKSKGTTYQCLIYHPDDFERVGRGLFKLRTEPAESRQAA